MRKLLNNPRFVAALVVVALLFVGYTVLRRPPAPPPPAPELEYFGDEAEAAPDEAGMAVPRRTLAEALALLPLPATVRDPFVVPEDGAEPESVAVAAAPEKRVGRVRLSAVWLQGTVILAVLNGQVCGVGESIERCRIEGVDLDGVWLAHPGGRARVAVGQEFTFTETP